MAKFKVGDVVVLKSGSPSMTVIEINKPAKGNLVFVKTVWFEGSTQHYKSFPEDTLDRKE